MCCLAAAIAEENIKTKKENKDNIKRNTKQWRKDIIRKIDVKSLTDKPVKELVVTINLTDRIKKENAIFDEIIKQLVPDNNQFYIEHDKK